MRARTNGGEVNHIPPKDAYIGEIDLTVNEGPGIWMTEEDHASVLSTGSSRQSIEHRARQRALIQEGGYGEAVQLDIDNIQAKFPDGRYEPAIRQMLGYIDNLNPRKLIPRSLVPH